MLIYCIETHRRLPQLFANIFVRIASIMRTSLCDRNCCEVGACMFEYTTSPKLFRSTTYTFLARFISYKIKNCLCSARSVKNFIIPYLPFHCLIFPYTYCTFYVLVISIHVTLHYFLVVFPRQKYTRQRSQPMWKMYVPINHSKMGNPNFCIFPCFDPQNWGRG